jgi:hypothetical protein
LIKILHNLSVCDDWQEGQKAIYHLEAFVAKFMSEYKSWSIAVLG